MGVCMLLGVVASGVVYMFWFGFALAFESDASNSGSLVLIMPLAFLFVIGWILVKLKKIREDRRYGNLKDTMRREIANEYALGVTLEDQICTILARKGSLTKDQLRQRISLPVTDEVLAVTLRELLTKKEVIQTIESNNAYYNIKDSN